MSLLITAFLGLSILLGAAIIKFAKDGEKLERISIALAFGSMTVLVLFDLIPEAIENLGKGHFILAVFCIATGIGILKLLDLFIPEHDHEHGLSHDCSEENVIHIGIISSFALILHNLIEGMAVCAICNESLSSGILVALGVGLHNIPMGMIIFAALSHESRFKRNAVISALVFSTFAGGLIMSMSFGFVSEFAIGILICFTLGMLIYISIFELLPHILHMKDKKEGILFSIVGAGISLLGILIG